MVTTSTSDALISTWNKTDKGLVVPTFKEKRGHLVMIDMKYKQMIQHVNEIISDDILKNIDTPEDYEKITWQKRL